MSVVDVETHSSPRRAEGALSDTAVVFSCDEKFIPLAKGLVLSLLATDQSLNLFCIDIGLKDTSRDWLRRRSVSLISFGWEQLFGANRVWRADQYRLAQYVRPFLPRLIPEFRYYIWLDADTWVQDRGAIALLRSAVHDSNTKDIALIPQIDFSYRVFQNQWGGPVEWSGWWYKKLYGETISREFCNKAILNSGVFCMRGESPLWRAWEIEIQAVLRKRISDRLVLHVAEQTCLNYIAYSFDRFVLVDSVYNYTLHDGCAKRNGKDGLVAIAYPPYRPISIVHLTVSSKYMQDYLREGLLFDKGAYLSEDERQLLLSLDHY
jgi:hypothetical protein